MTQPMCPKCGSTEYPVCGYGFAAGPLGSYTICSGCGHLLEFSPDLEGMGEAEAGAMLEHVDKWRAGNDDLHDDTYP